MSPRAMAVTTAIGLGLLLAVGVVFMLGWATGGISAGARTLHAVDEGLRLATVARAQLGLAVHLDAIATRYDADVSDAFDASLRDVVDAQGQIWRIDGSGALDGHPIMRVTLTRIASNSDLAIRALRDADNDEAGRIVRDLIDPDFRAFTRAAADERSGLLADIESSDELSTRLGEVARLLLVLIIPAALVLVYREITVRQLRSRELEVRLEAEQELAKARDEFVANASHELRTPLTAIYGLGQLLEEDESLPEQVREMLGMMNGEAAELSRMVEDLLTTARLAAGQLRYEPEAVETAEDAEAIVQPFVRNGANIRLEVEDAVVWADRLRQRQVLRNLISNSVKYGGGQIRLRGESEAGCYRWSVSDNGPGVPKELEERLFQRFVHTLTFRQAVAGGVGLGLSIVKSLAEGMGGAVAYERSDGWTSFVVRVPLPEPVANSPAEEMAVP
jgi:signal transduction histidine kinase